MGQQHQHVYLRDCPRAEECPHEFVEVFTQACGPILYSVKSSAPPKTWNPRTCMQDEPTGVPINQATKFENLVGFLDLVSGSHGLLGWRLVEDDVKQVNVYKNTIVKFHSSFRRRSIYHSITGKEGTSTCISFSSIFSLIAFYEVASGASACYLRISPWISLKMFYASWGFFGDREVAGLIDEWRYELDPLLPTSGHHIEEADHKHYRCGSDPSRKAKTEPCIWVSRGNLCPNGGAL
ncbi:NADH:ubiquinone dehydrogenase subunit 5 [Datura stramonium]|uniref:NADH:ubiquinone dehydrogenase subunit 5 n=1 Tax=Datura stramonium TaxID=4076 RepID=A0ABS8WGZ8_DATST|nr:NADH:ubiquinone dehydrogenase subunit 5 [Datura stramonium]